MGSAHVAHTGGLKGPELLLLWSEPVPGPQGPTGSHAPDCPSAGPDWAAAKPLSPENPEPLGGACWKQTRKVGAPGRD